MIRQAAKRSFDFARTCITSQVKDLSIEIREILY
jgi:hypothetical protein